jgi:hypothetical protein
VLLSVESWRGQLMGFFPGDKAEHPYSWADDTAPTGLSADGRLLSFFEAGDLYSLFSDTLSSGTRMFP